MNAPGGPAVSHCASSDPSHQLDHARIATLEAEVERLRAAWVTVQAVMARHGSMPNQLATWWSPDTDSDVTPLDSAGQQLATVQFLSWLLKRAILEGEGET